MGTAAGETALHAEWFRAGKCCLVRGEAHWLGRGHINARTHCPGLIQQSLDHSFPGTRFPPPQWNTSSVLSEAPTEPGDPWRPT